MLTAPIDRASTASPGSFPYGLAGAGIVLLAVVATRWSRRREAEAEPAAPVDPAIEERLDDELRNLD